MQESPQLHKLPAAMYWIQAPVKRCLRLASRDRPNPISLKANASTRTGTMGDYAPRRCPGGRRR
jgi:hypothetical protein